MSRKHVALEHAAFARQRHPGRVQRHDQRFELGHGTLHHRRRFVALLQFEPVEAVRCQRDHVGQFADRGKSRAAEHLQGNAPLEGREIKFGRLRRARQIGNAENSLFLGLPDIGEHGAVLGAHESHGTAAEGGGGFAHRDQFLGGGEQRAEAARLRLHIHRLIAIDGIHDHRRVEPCRIGARKSAIAVRGPLHRRAHAVAIAEIDVVAHADLVAVIDDRRARE